MASNNKSPKFSKKIGTHNGMFHCDEALACFMLKLLPDYRDADIIRSRDLKILEDCDIVVDVGATFDPKRHRYDHHQRGFNETLNSVRPDLAQNKFNIIRLSSAGLIYSQFGLEILAEIIKLNKKIPTPDILEALFIYVYEYFVEELDAMDNGIPMYSEGQPRYKINTHLGARVHRLNPSWNDPNPEDEEVLFQKAMKLVGQEFVEVVLDGFNVWWPAREIVKKSIESRKEVHKSGQIMVLNDRCSWKNHLYSIEEELKIEGELKFCLFHDENSDTWRIQAIPIQPNSFVCRVFLHKNWRGVRDEELSKVANIKDCIFCHASGFIGGNKTKEGALDMALRSLQAAQIDKD
ncbi:MYG1 exonuclease isoform X2 [Euwallacea similis]